MNNYLRYLHLFVLIVSTAYCLFAWSKKTTIIKIFIVVTTLVELYGNYFLLKNQHITQELYNFYTAFEIIIWLYFFKLNLEIKHNYAYFIFCFLYVSIFLLLLNLNLKKLNQNFYLVNNLVISINIIYYFYAQIRYDKALNGTFFIATGAFIFYTGGFLLTGMIYEVSTFDNNLASQLFNINLILNLLFYPLMLFGLLIEDNRLKNPLSSI